MSTQLALGLVGGAVGSFFGPTGAQIGFALGSAAGASLQTVRNQGPRLSDLKAPQSSYGSVLPYVEGMVRTAGVWAWNSDKHEISQTADGGGKGGPSVENTTYTYKMDALILLSENMLGGIRRVWSNGKLIWSATENAEDDTLLASATTDSWDRMTFYSGAADQLPDPTYEAAVGSGNAPAYRGRGSVFIQGLNLGGSGQPPLLAFEVFSAGEPAVQGFYEDFEQGLAGYAATEGSLDIFMLQQGAAGTQVVTAKSAVYNTIERELDAPTTPSMLSWVVSMPGLLDTDDAGFISFRNGTGNTVASFLPMREYDQDVRRRAYLNLPGVGFKFFGPDAPNNALIQGRYYRVVVRNTAAIDGKVIATITDFMTGGLVHEEEFTGVSASYTWTVDRLAFGNDNNVDVIAAAYAQVQIGGGRAAPDAVPLADAIERQCLRAGLVADEVDVSAVTGTVRGFAVSSVTAPRTVLEMLMGAYQLEALETGGKLTFRPRAQATVLSIPYDDLGAAEGEPVEPLPLVRANDQELPAQVVIRFANAINDYQDGAEASARIGANLAVVDAIELPLVLSPTEARRIAEIRKADIVNSVHRVEQLQLDASYAALEPGDAIEVTDQDGQAFRLRIGRITDSGLVRRIEAAIDEQSAMTGAANADDDYLGSDNVALSTGTSMELLDIPLLRDVDDGLIHYLAVGKQANDRSWPGAAVYRGRNDSGYVSAATFTDRTYIGRTTAALGDFLGGAVFDELNALAVTGVGDLESWTRDEILAGSSPALLVGDEIILWRSATETAPGTYLLRGLLRGRRGTEWAIAGHEIDERVVLLATSGLRVITNTAAEVGQSFDFKAVTNGTALDAAFPQAFTNTLISRKPFAPVDGRAAPLPSGSTEISWKRRTRLAVGFTGPTGSVVPLGESSERYEVDLFDDADVLMFTVSTTTPSYQIGSLIPVGSYDQVLNYPALIDDVLWGVWDRSLVPFVTKNQAVAGVNLSDGAGVGLSDVLAIGRADAAVYVDSVCYVAVSDLDPSIGTLNDTRLCRVDLSTTPPSVTATWEPGSLDLLRSLYWDGSAIWSYGLASGALLKHNAVTLAVEETYDAPDMGGVSSGGCMAAGGGKFYTIDGHNVRGFTAAGLPSYSWTFDAETLGADVWPSGLAYVGSLLFVSSPSRTFVLDPADGSLVQAALPPSETVFEDFNGDAVFFSAGYIRKASGTTGELGQFFFVGGAVRFLGPVKGLDRLAVQGTDPSFDSTVLLKEGGTLAGYQARIYQMSAEAGRGYPLVIDL